MTQYPKLGIVWKSQHTGTVAVCYRGALTMLPILKRYLPRRTSPSLSLSPPLKFLILLINAFLI
jgi:hypothetical protein